MHAHTQTRTHMHSRTHTWTLTEVTFEYFTKVYCNVMTQMHMIAWSWYWPDLSCNTLLAKSVDLVLGQFLVFSCVDQATIVSCFSSL